MIKADIDTLKHYIDNGIKLIGTYESGALIAGGDSDKYKEAFTSCLADIKALCLGKGDLQGRAKGTVIKAFRFIPKDNGYLIIDIDRNHADGIDGLELFYTFFEKIGKTRDTMPQAMQNIERGSFPCFLSTPSGGFYLYFKFNQDVKVKTTLDAKGIDILYTKQAAAAGSIKLKGEYILHGKLTDAPILYGFIKKHILQPSPLANSNLKYKYTNAIIKSLQITPFGIKEKKTNIVVTKFMNITTHGMKSLSTQTRMATVLVDVIIKLTVLHTKQQLMAGICKTQYTS
ncbi:hypothetical protein AGMMS49921_12210 [Endomicrobiia bacterium]|nr:hypothetical protein AGMMS49921_12210 [Endomicrobiia bacterium]